MRILLCFRQFRRAGYGKGAEKQANQSRIRIEEGDGISFAVSCRHCEEPYCVKGCISGALSIEDGVIHIDSSKCVGCYTCILSCPYGAVMPSDTGAIQKCELCMNNSAGAPACVKGCPNQAIVYEEKMTMKYVIIGNSAAPSAQSRGSAP